MRPTIILLVEDEPVIALDVKHRLEREGHRVLCADQLDDALWLCMHHQPGLALVNFRMKGSTDGMAFARLLQARFQLPVGFLTGARSQDLSGSPDFDNRFKVLHKPFTRHQLEVFLRESKQDID